MPPKRKLRANTCKMLKDEEYKILTSFPPSTLPTIKEVIEYMLNSESRNDKYITELSQQLSKHWILCNVYPLSLFTIKQKIKDLFANFDRLVRYPKSKRGEKWNNDADIFNQNSNQLFDIYCDDDVQRGKLEKEYKLRMSADDFEFYNDQKTLRRRQCTSKVVPYTSSDVNFQKRILQEQNRQTENYSVSELKTVESTSDSQSSNESEFSCFIERKKSTRNTHDLRHLAKVCDRYNISDRCGAAIANAALLDYGVIKENDMNLAIDKSKLRRQRSKHREIAKEEDKQNVLLIDGIGIDGRKDATLTTMKSDITEHYYSTTILEEHYVITGEPGDFYVSHTTPDSGKGVDIAMSIFKELENTDLVDRLHLIKSDGTNTMTGYENGAIRNIELLLGKPLQWSICMLHLNELPLRHMFIDIDGTTTGPDSFSGPIGKELNGNVSDWDIYNNFKAIPGFNIDMPQEIINDLSTDQYYAYKMSKAVSSGNVDQELELLEVGPLVHSRWLTLACRILRLYVSKRKPSKNLILLSKFVINVYMKSYFDIKRNYKITDGSKNLFSLINRIKEFSKKIQDICFEVLNNNSYFAHGENILLSMLADIDDKLRKNAVDIILHLKSSPSSTTNVRVFKKPAINFKSNTYTEMSPQSTWHTVPPLLNTLSNNDILTFLTIPLKSKHTCHSQNVERHIKNVTEAAHTVSGFERRDGMIRQKIRSRKLMKKFDSKKQFKS